VDAEEPSTGGILTQNAPLGSVVAMKAIRVHAFGGPETLQLESIPDLRPGDGEVVIAVRAAGVNPVDSYIRSGTHAIRPELPYTPGLDAAGLVTALGAGVVHIATGARVYVAGSLSGTYAEQVRCRASQVHPLPESVSFAAGAALGVPYATAYRALFQVGDARPGQTLLVRGASGGVGLAAVQLAHAAGLRVIGTAGTEAGRRLVREQGADVVVDHGAADIGAALRDATAGQGADRILEMLANRNLGEDLGLLARGGRIVVIGSRGRVEVDARDLMSRGGTVTGFTLFQTPEAELASIHAALAAALRSGVARPVIARELPLAAAATAHTAILEPGAHGKIVLVP
jgi:NADPH2:quinone reductase